ncbi:MAG: hypothetical protein ACR650_00145 [Methylocystis sp.]
MDIGERGDSHDRTDAPNIDGKALMERDVTKEESREVCCNED